MLEGDEHRIAVEVQWSPQTLDAYRARTRRYAADGIRTFWLHRSRTIEGLHADELEHRRVGVRGSEAEHHCYVLDGVRALQVAEFVKCLVEGRLLTAPTRGRSDSDQPEWNFPTALAHAIARGAGATLDLDVPPGVHFSRDGLGGS